MMKRATSCHVSVRRRPLAGLVLTGSAALLLTGCATSMRHPLEPVAPYLEWPAAPESARVRYLGSLTSSEDVAGRSSWSRTWREITHGPDAPRRLVTPHAVAVHESGAVAAIADTNAVGVHLFDLVALTYRFVPTSVSMADAAELDGSSMGRDGADGIDAEIGASSVEGDESADSCPVAVAWVGDALWIADASLGALLVCEDARAGSEDELEVLIVVGEPLERPAGLAYCASNDLIYATDSALHQVLVFDRTGELVDQFGLPGKEPGQFHHPTQIVCHEQFGLAVADAMNFRVQRFSLDGRLERVFGKSGDASGDLALPKGVALDDRGNVWVVDARFENVQAFDAEGRLLLVIGQEGGAPGMFWLPAGAFIDRQQRLWIADTYNRRVQVFELLP
jgi:DNA-binding beta-propeller fold protein YncE